MSVEDYYPVGDGPPDDEHPEGGVRCKRCGADGLEWLDTGMRWRLIDENAKPHECGRVASAEDFS